MAARHRFLAVTLTATCLAMTMPAAAKPLGVVELFTSQGCNSCPPADAALGRFVRQGNVVVLAYHVDYWDYLGWKDTLGSRANTERQYAYAKGFGSSQVYTPQAVINGRSQMNGGYVGEVEAELDMLDQSGGGLVVDISVRDTGNSYVVEAGAAKDGTGEARVILVSYAPQRDIPIRRGENSGRTITYWHAVTGTHIAGMWHGKPMRYEVPKAALPSDGGLAVLLQSGVGGAAGPILGAATLGDTGS
ncbi:DUF1223 domain-containing protein [Mesorhizobium koreense]|uniref:DUF1223 domain-containing protein n=1 Tax=Mesorhizobium koreense TaxID=3074855 RepID=UPI00287BB7F9|nr:DUF1223 domain-containing protein [Mesorhizobium sp. WR6]